ncbi:hypothetical protein ABN034_17665 [Actinopolymorpha sp. B11F2]|uniref:hypothetical protein n=1 Tax=Actinopolymorpha sp. B11F2 TaxID=3160862 RepID=UPI0032E48B9C
MNDVMINALAHARLDDLRRAAARKRLAAEARRPAPSGLPTRVLVRIPRQRRWFAGGERRVRGARAGRVGRGTS